jgi:type IV secretory pathway protease TraF
VTPTLGKTTSNTGFARLQGAIIAVLLAAMTLLVVRVGFVSGLVRRITIDGPSMAPAFLGRHYRVVCGDCRFAFDCDAEHLPADGQAVCPNCGFLRNGLESATLLPPDRVLVDRWPLLWQSPKRGDCLAFVAPQAGGLAVKRLAALPGETWGLRDGDLHIGGQIIRKSAAERRATQILVHDNRYRPKTTGLPPRWRPASATSRWRNVEDGFRGDPGPDPGPDSGGDFDWLEYEHWQCTADEISRGVAAAVTDNDSFNQGDTRRTLNRVHDVWLTCRVRLEKSGRLALAAVDGGQRFQIELDPQTGAAALTSAGQALAQRRLERNLASSAMNIEFGLCDQQVLLLIDGRRIFLHRYARPGNGHGKVLHPLAIGTRGGGLKVSELRVWRDIYYLDPQGLARDWQASAPLKPGEFALLGDNQPVSLDSRQWGAIGRQAVLGRVSRLFSAAPRVE